MTLILAISAGLLAFLVLAILLTFSMQERINLDARLAGMGGETVDSGPVKIKKKRTARAPVSRAFANELSNAGIKMRPEEFLTVWFCAALLPSGILIFMGAHIVSAIALSVAGFIIPPVMVMKRKKKRMLLFENQLGEALILIGNCLRSGLTFQQAMANIASEMQDPIAHEFARAVKEIQLGSSVDIALENMTLRVNSTDLLLTVSAVQIQRQVGGNLLEILENIAVTIKDRIKIKADIRVMTATGRSSGAIVGLIPVAIGGMLMLINPSYIMTFFDTRMGIGLLIFAGVMEFAGFMVIRKVVDIKY